MIVKRRASSFLRGRPRDKSKPDVDFPSSHGADLQAKCRGKLCVAIFDARKAENEMHPAAHCCMSVLRHPWFLSKAVERVLRGDGKRRGFSSTKTWGRHRLALTSPVDAILVSPEEILAGCLEECHEGDHRRVFDVLVVPGGSSVEYSLRLGEQGRAAVLRFIHHGGGYCGICAGAFLALHDWPHTVGQSLQLVRSGLALAPGAEVLESTEARASDISHGMNQTSELSQERGEAVGGQFDSRKNVGGPCSSIAQRTKQAPRRKSSRLGQHIAVENSNLRFGDAAEALSRMQEESPRSFGKVKAQPKFARQEQYASPGHRSNSMKLDLQARAALPVEVHFSELGRRLLWCEGRARSDEPEEVMDSVVVMRYHNGPLLVAAECGTRTLATMFTTRENAQDVASAPAALQGTIACLAEDIGGGRAVLLSPHTESTQTWQCELVSQPGKQRLQRVLQRAVLLAAAGPNAGRPWIEELCHLPA